MMLWERLFAGFFVICTTMWIAMVVHHHVRDPRLRRLASLVPVAVVGISLVLLPMRPWALAVWLGFMLIAIPWWLSLRPRSDRDWKSGMEVLPQAEAVGDVLRVRQFRNFRYTASGDPLPQYEERTFDLAKL